MIRWAVAILLLLPATADASQKRSRAVVRQFERLVPCPLQGPGTCFQKGFEADHRIPICLGGRDEPWQLQWLTIEDHDRKTVLDLRICAALRAVR